MIAIRSAQAPDRSAIAALHAASWRVAYRGLLPDVFLDEAVDAFMTARWTTRVAGPRDALLVAEAAGGICGFVAVWAQDETAFIDNLHVARVHHGQGVGTALLRAAAGRMAGHGCTRAYLHVLNGNGPARRLYAALGGREGPAFVDDLVGHAVTTHRIDWPDIGLLAGPGSGAAGSGTIDCAEQQEDG